MKIGNSHCLLILKINYPNNAFLTAWYSLSELNVAPANASTGAASLEATLAASKPT